MSAPSHVTFDTSVGSFTVELYTNHAPKVRQAQSYHYQGLNAWTIPAFKGEEGQRLTEVLMRRLCPEQTCNNFSKLAERGYYNGVVFHRIIPVRLLPRISPGRSSCRQLLEISTATMRGMRD